jgi:hypothetical protein
VVGDHCRLFCVPKLQNKHCSFFCYERKLHPNNVYNIGHTGVNVKIIFLCHSLKKLNNTVFWPSLIFEIKAMSGVV